MQALQQGKKDTTLHTNGSKKRSLFHLCATRSRG
jgi:hypothetical protein